MSRKEAYQEKIRARLDKWQAEIEKFKAQTRESKADAKIEFYQQLDELTHSQKTAQRKLQELRRASSESWAELEAGVDNAVAALHQSLDRAQQKMRITRQKSTVPR